MLTPIVAPLVSAEALFLGIVWNWSRHPAPRPTRGSGTAGPGLVRYLAVMTGGGFLVFLGIVLLFHVWLAGQRGALRSAAVGGAFLASVAAATFLTVSWLGSRSSHT